MSKTLLAALLLIASCRALLADEKFQLQDRGGEPALHSALSPSNGLLMLDYEQISLASGGKFDLLSASYLHRLNDWLYFGVGFGAPMVEGNYGGFFAGGIALHAQKKVVGNWFVDGGLAYGAGAGGASVNHIKALSGSGNYTKGYLGFGFNSGAFSYGVNYSKLSIKDSPIRDTAINFFVQRPLSFPIGSYNDTGRLLEAGEFKYLGRESIVSLEYSNLLQIDPAGSYGGRIGLMSGQFSHFFDAKNYWFFDLDIGYSGLVWFNQVQGGIGRRIALSPKVNLYGQLGIGSGGWVTDTIDTGPGLVVFPEARVEYAFDNGMGAFLSAGYLVAPKGSSKNWALGAGVNFHLPSSDLDLTGDDDVALRGLRLSVTERRLFDVSFANESIDDLDLVALQLDYSLNRNWYVPIQLAAATNDFKGYAGYVEGLAGLGWQSDPFASGKLQLYGQILYGLNDLDIGRGPADDIGALLYPSIGFNYNLTDQYSIYGQLGRTTSLGQYFRPGVANAFDNSSVGLGISYRFSLPVRASG